MVIFYDIVISFNHIDLRFSYYCFFYFSRTKSYCVIQRRRGPNVVGIFGLLQAIADGLKLVGKEVIVPAKANADLFILAPIITFATSLIH